jgi:hypothetical protein
MFRWKSRSKSLSPLGDGDTGWEPDRLEAAFPPKPLGAAAGQDRNLIFLTESTASHTGRHGGSVANNAPAALKTPAIAAAKFPNPITVTIHFGWGEVGG